MIYNPHADNAGTEPHEGDYVAYNYSGQVAAGFIRHVGRTKSGRPTGRYTIHQVLPKEGHISRIKGGAKCLLVLEKDLLARELRQKRELSEHSA